MIYTHEQQLEAATYCLTVLKPQADACHAEVTRLPWWRMWAKEKALKRYREINDEWERRLRAVGL